MKWYQVSTQNGVNTYVLNTPKGCIVRTENQIPDVDDYRPTATLVPDVWWNIALGLWAIRTNAGFMVCKNTDWNALGGKCKPKGESDE